MTAGPIDWCELDKITNNKKELAKEMIEMLANELPSRQEKINTALREKNWETLLEHVHKLHGSTAYCAATQLRDLARELENQLRKQQRNNAETLINKINLEISIFLEMIKND